MPFTADEANELPSIISAPRFATYLQAMGNDRDGALALYEWNLDLSSALIVPLQVCEVAIRNGIADAIQLVHGANWPWNNGFIRSLPRPKRSFDGSVAKIVKLEHAWRRLVQITSDIELSGAGCTTAITPNQLVQSSSENDIWYLS